MQSIVRWKELALARSNFFNYFDYAAQLASKHKIKLKSGKPSEKWWQQMKRWNKRVCLHGPKLTASVRHMCMDSHRVVKLFCRIRQPHTKKACQEVESRYGIWFRQACSWNTNHAVSLHKKENGIFMLTQVVIETQLQSLLASMLLVMQFLHVSLPKEKRTEHCMVLIFSLHQQVQHRVCQTAGGWSRALPDSGLKNFFLPNIGPERPQVLVLDGRESHNFVELIELAYGKQDRDCWAASTHITLAPTMWSYSFQAIERCIQWCMSAAN